MRWSVCHGGYCRSLAPTTEAGWRLVSRALAVWRVVTPLFIVVITIGGTDILFALDGSGHEAAFVSYRERKPLIPRSAR